ncbi:MAG: hypothetical protein ABR537_13125 [Gemmatimonadales bacterium]
METAIGPRLVSLIALVVAVAAGITGRAIWLAAAGHERTRFLAQIAVLESALFSLIMLLQVVATLLLPSCHERPRTPQSPDVLRPQTAQSPSLT